MFYLVVNLGSYAETHTHTHCRRRSLCITVLSGKRQMPSEPYNSLANDLCEFKQYWTLSIGVFYIRSPCATPIKTWPYPPDTVGHWYRYKHRYRYRGRGRGRCSCRYKIQRGVFGLSFIRARPSESYIHLNLRFLNHFVYVHVQNLSPASASLEHWRRDVASASQSTLTQAQRRVNNADPLDELQLTRSPSQRCSFSSCSGRAAQQQQNFMHNICTCFTLREMMI